MALGDITGDCTGQVDLDALDQTASNSLDLQVQVSSKVNQIKLKQFSNSNKLTSIASTLNSINPGLASNFAEIQATLEGIDDIKDDVSELLAAPKIYYGDVVIDTIHTLDFFYNLGSALNNVVGDVTIDASEDMDYVKVQIIASQLYNVKGDVSISAGITIDTFNLVTSKSLTKTVV